MIALAVQLKGLVRFLINAGHLRVFVMKLQFEWMAQYLELNQFKSSQAAYDLSTFDTFLHLVKAAKRCLSCLKDKLFTKAKIGFQNCKSSVNYI